MASKFSVKIEKLDGTNYNCWKLDVQLAIEASELWEVADGSETLPADDTKKKAWELKDAQARAIIVPSLDQTQKNHIYSCKTAKEMLDKLRNLHTDSSILNLQHTMTKFLNHQIGKDVSPVKAMLELPELARMLADMQNPVSDAWLVNRFVSSLPAEYLPFNKSWASVPVKSQTSEILMARLKKEELEKRVANETEDAESTRAFYAGNDRQHTDKHTSERRISDVKCFKCGEIGHYESNCRSGISGNSHGNRGDRGQGDRRQGGRGHADRGHADRGQGDRDMEIVDTENEDVLSWAELMIHLNDQVHVHRITHLKLKRPSTRQEHSWDGLLFRPLQERISAFVAISRQDNTRLWNQRLVHKNCKYISETACKNAVRGLADIDANNKVICESCELGKQKRKPLPRKTSTYNYQPGETLYADLAGRFSIPALGGARYFLLVKDHATSFRLAYFLKKKDETTQCIKDCVAYLANQTKNTVKLFQSDNGGEFVNQELGRFFRQKGIGHETTAAYCPENKQSPAIPAHEAIFGRKPSLAHVRIFGCTVYVHIPEETRTCGQNKGKKCIFVGYSSMDRKYRMYDEETDRDFEDPISFATFHEVEPLPVQTLRQIAEAEITIHEPTGNNPEPAVEEEQISLVCPIVPTPSSIPPTQEHQNQQTTLDNPTPSTSSSAQKT
ncbi:unnamed protein product, partial [Allacma fusca]